MALCVHCPGSLLPTRSCMACPMSSWTLPTLLRLRHLLSVPSRLLLSTSWQRGAQALPCLHLLPSRSVHKPSAPLTSQALLIPHLTWLPFVHSIKSKLHLPGLIAGSQQSTLPLGLPLALPGPPSAYHSSLHLLSTYAPLSASLLRVMGAQTTDVGSSCTGRLWMVGQ